MQYGLDSPELLLHICDLARTAGGEILEIYNSDFEVEDKADGSPLTAADRAAHESIVTGLKALTPSIPVLSEESKDIDYAERSSWQRYWLVDPLDGTREFVKRNGEFTVNIALVENGSPVLGVVYVPVTGVIYYASRGVGAFKQLADQAPQPIRVKLFSGGTARVVASRSHAGEAVQKFIDAVGDVEIVSMGSSLKLCLVAEGAADVYPRLGPTSEWDTAAAHCIVEEAGGQLTMTDMQPLEYNTKESLLNPHFFVFGDTSVNWSKYL